MKQFPACELFYTGVKEYHSKLSELPSVKDSASINSEKNACYATSEEEDTSKKKKAKMKMIPGIVL